MKKIVFVLLLILFSLNLSVAVEPVEEIVDDNRIDCKQAYDETVKVFWAYDPKTAKEFALKNYPECVGGN